MGSLIPLKDELDMIRCYLDIQQFRFGNRLTYEIYLDQGASDILITPLIVQPLVENAVIHGLEYMEDNGILKVHATIEDHHLRIEVSDNGIGFSESRLKKIDEAMSDTQDKQEHRIGLRNVHQRLKLMYGDTYGLTIISNEGMGTCIYFSIPIQG
jgi:two-component system, sensor histidine kinase YesM